MGVVNQQPKEVSGKTIYKRDGRAHTGKYQILTVLVD
jgi:hypothetical protein